MKCSLGISNFLEEICQGPALVGSRVSSVMASANDLERDKERMLYIENRGEKEADVPLFTQKANKAPRQGTCTVHVGCRHPPGLLRE